jgi:hypothetical protein
MCWAWNNCFCVLFIYLYERFLKGIYNQGSYLAVFHEGGEVGFQWHRLSRFRNELIGKKLDWGEDDKWGGWLLILLVSANIGGPLWFLRVAEGDSFEWISLLPRNLFEWVSLVIAAILFVRMVIVVKHLFTTAKFMRENMKIWRQVRIKLKENANLLEDTIKQVVE